MEQYSKEEIEILKLLPDTTGLTKEETIKKYTDAGWTFISAPGIAEVANRFVSLFQFLYDTKCCSLHQKDSPEYYHE